MSSSQKQTSESSILQSNISAWILRAVEKNSGRQGTAFFRPPKPSNLEGCHQLIQILPAAPSCIGLQNFTQNIPRHPNTSFRLQYHPGLQTEGFLGRSTAGLSDWGSSQAPAPTHPAKRGHRTWWCLRSNRPGPWLVTKGVFLVSDTQIEVHTHRPQGDKPMSFPFGIRVQAGPSEIVVLDSGQMKMEKLGKASENNFWLLQVAWLWKGYR